MVAIPKYEDVLLRRGCVLTGINGGRGSAGGCPVTEESWRLGLAPLEAGHKSWAVAVSPSVLTTPVSPYSHYLQWPSLTTTRYVASVHSCSVILPTRDIVRSSNPRAQTELLSNVGDMFYVRDLRDLAIVVSCHTSYIDELSISKMSLSNQKRDL